MRGLFNQGNSGEFHNFRVILCRVYDIVSSIIQFSRVKYC